MNQDVPGARVSCHRSSQLDQNCALRPSGCRPACAQIPRVWTARWC